jgi:hypothetical protein
LQQWVKTKEALITYLGTGLGVVGGFEKRLPGTAADVLLMYKIR